VGALTRLKLGRAPTPSSDLRHLEIRLPGQERGLLQQAVLSIQHRTAYRPGNNIRVISLPRDSHKPSFQFIEADIWISDAFPIPSR